MLKKIGAILALLIVAVISLLNLKLFTLKSDSNTLGPHGTLVAEKEINSRVIYEYCIKNDLDSKQIDIFEAIYSVYNTGVTEAPVVVPIPNPSVMKNVIGVYSSIPVVENTEKNGLPYSLKIDPKWLKDKQTGVLQEPLVIRIAYQADDVDYLPDNILVSSVVSQELIEQTKHNPDLKMTIELAEQIKLELPKADQDNLKKLVKAYAMWIDQNIMYPLEDLDPITHKYININNPDKTLSYKVGVCEDNVNILLGMLNSQGIEAYFAVGKMATSSTFEEIFPDNYTLHGVVSIKTPQGYFTIDPTTQSLESSQITTLKDGKALKVTRPQKTPDLVTSPMYIESIEDISGLNRDISFDTIFVLKLDKLRYFRH